MRTRRPFDKTALRADTPGCEHVLHLDYAGSSLPPHQVVEAVKAHLDLEARWGGYRAAQAVAEQTDAFYGDVARLIGAESDEIAYVDSATRAWQLAFAAIAWKPGDRILCSRSEYASNHLAFLQLQRRVPVEVVAIDADGSATIDLAQLEAELERGAALVALTHVPTNGGMVQPAREVGELCRGADVPLLLDACQAAGQVDLRDVGWDMLAATGRKYLRGPRGTGFLGVRRAWLDRLEPPVADLLGATWTGPESYQLRDDARRFELWERSAADMLGLATAVRYALDIGVDVLEAEIAATAASLRARLAALAGVQVHDRGDVLCGIVTFTVDDCAPDRLKALLRERDVHISVSRRPSTLLDMADRDLDAIARASVHALTTEDELDAFVEHIEHVRRT